ncbi:MAG: hypothetical protein IKQ78_04680 [Bacilli bacterium]|nr:hypothetical protein [Bacilli bacterium]
MEKEEILVRVVKGDWRTNETLFLSEPVTVARALEMEKEMVPLLPPRGSGDSVLVKFVEDRGPDYDYMSCGGWMIFTHREIFLSVS